MLTLLIVISLYEWRNLCSLPASSQDLSRSKYVKAVPQRYSQSKQETKMLISGLQNQIMGKEPFEPIQASTLPEWCWKEAQKSSCLLVPQRFTSACFGGFFLRIVLSCSATHRYPSASKSTLNSSWAVGLMWMLLFLEAQTAWNYIS